MQPVAHERADTLPQAHLFWRGVIELRGRVLPASRGADSGLGRILRLSVGRRKCRGRLRGGEHIVGLLVGAERV
jgi:hypothetical protein